jgi:UDP-N-acetylglucosamine--N-acetylmuramyl-(pentapeptide) pyrophosphoryl-undecaprenol N-acetylglucosamine transferase
MTVANSPVVIAAGGTGGHLFPAQALAQELERRRWPIVLVTDDRGMAFAKSFPHADIHLISAATFANRGPLGRIVAAVRILGGVLRAFFLLGKVHPAVVVGFGGYPSLPTMAAAVLRRSPRCIHEQNAILGRVNKLIAPWINQVASTFDHLIGISEKDVSKIVVTGNPLRDAVRNVAPTDFRSIDGQGPINLLVFGGSQGAHIFGEVIPGAVAKLPLSIRERVNVTQQCRESDLKSVQEQYSTAGVKANVAPFFDDLPAKIVDAHLVISRAGASTVCELAAIGRPSLLVPLPSAMDDHQTVNAALLSDRDAAWLIPQVEFTQETVSRRLAELLSDPNKLAQAASAAASLGRPDATDALADLVETLCPAHRPSAGSASA